MNLPKPKGEAPSRRLVKAVIWIKEYIGKNLVRGYRKRFGEDLIHIRP